MHSIIAAVPWLSILDKKLHPNDRQVLAVLCYFQDQATNITTIDRKTIAKYSGVHETKISPSTLRLEGQGWITKNGTTRDKSYYINWGNIPPGLDAETASNQFNRLDPLGAGSATNQPNHTPLLDAETASNQFNRLDPLGAGSATNQPNHTPRLDAETASNGAVLTNHGTTISSDQIRSDQIDPIINNQIISDRGQAITFRQAVAILEPYGCTYAINENDGTASSNQIHDWIAKGYDVDLIKAGAAQAEKARKGKTDKPLSPQYVDKCINTILSTRNESRSYQSQQKPTATAHHNTQRVITTLPGPADRKGMEEFATKYGFEVPENVTDLELHSVLSRQFSRLRREQKQAAA